MKFALRSASGAALLLGMVGSAWGQTVATTQTDAQAQAQTTATTADQGAAQKTDKVVITGSLIAQSAEDAPLPVDVYSMEDLQDQGAPSVQEFARSLSQSGETSGEFSILTGAGNAGTSNVSLRGLGSDRTMTLLNGRRSSENTNYIPMMALSRVEVLKDGAGVTYGAGAVAGVVNFVTRRDVDGLELSVQNKMYQGSSGELNVSALTGWVGDSSNFLLGLTFERQGNLPMVKRPKLLYSYDEQPIQYTGGATAAPNPGTYFSGASSTVLRDFNQQSCQDLGGTSRTGTPFGTANAPECWYNFTPFYDLVNKEKDFRVYAEYNSDLNDTMEFHVEAAYAKADSPEIMFSPAGNPVASHRAVIGGTALSGTSSVITATTRMFEIPIVNDGWNDTNAGVVAGGGVRNPFIDKFYNDLRARYGTTVAGASNPTTGSLYTGSSWRPFAQGGNPLFGYQGRYQRNYRDFFQLAGSLEGDFTPGALGMLEGLHYKNSLSIDNSWSKTFLPDIITSRLQNAMRGYGGPDCTAVDRVATQYTSIAAYDRTVGIQDPTVAPGTNGCQWFNPFASAYQTNQFTGAAFSGYGGAGYDNSYELVDWLHEDQGSEVQTTNFTASSVISGLTPFTLPGGEIAFALGSEWRYEQVRNRVLGDDDLRQLSRQSCVWTDQVTGVTVTGTTVNGVTPAICANDEPGPWYEYGDQIDFDSLDERRTFAGYTEIQIPVFDNLNFQVGGRYESFDGNIGKIWKVAGKWDILRDLSVRGSLGTNYVAPPVGLRPGYSATGITFDATFLNTVPTTIYTQTDIVPEVSNNKNFGISWTPSFGDNNFRFSVDYFDINDQNQITTTGLRVLLNQVVPTSSSFTTVVAGVPQTIAQIDTGRNVALSRLDCDAPLIAFFTLNSPCVAGVTNMSNVTDIRLTRLNGPTFNTSGVDFTFSYDRPLFGGTLMANMTGTQVASYELEGYSVNGVTIEASGNRLGYNNNSRSGEFSSKLRGNASLGWSGFGHSFRLQANHVKGVFDELGCTGVTSVPGVAESPTDSINPSPSACGGTGYSTNNLGTAGLTGSGIPTKVKDYTDYDFHWRFSPDYMKDVELRLSVYNFLDVAPPRDVRARDGYLTTIAPDGARGRQFEVGLTKRF